jgi:hypothetical protein
MRRARAACSPWIGSLLVHGGVVGVALVCRSDHDRAHEESERAVAFIDVEAASDEAAPDPESRMETGEAGGPAAPAAFAGPPAPAPRASHPSVKRRTESEHADDAEPSAVSSASARIAANRSSPTPATGGDQSRVGIGSGIGNGASTGGGVGAGAGRGRSRADAAVRVRSPARPPRSKARPARLIYPVRDREERPGEVFVVRLTVNEKGYVVGVRLEQGVSRDRDEKALNAVWRFHYDPALDRGGRPIRSQVVQRFMVE